MKAVIFTLCALVASVPGFARPKTEAQVFFHPTDILYIEVIDSVGHYSVGRNDRFRNIKNTIEEVLEEIDFPIEYKVVRFGANRNPEGHPQLNLTMMKWENNGMGQIEARFGASLRRNLDRDKLGVYYDRGGMGPFFSSETDRVYNEVLRKALFKMAPELNARVLYEPFAGEEGEVEGDEAEVPSPEAE